RIPRNKSIFMPASYCPKCKKPIKWYDNMPLLSYVLLGGKCRFCHKKIPVFYPIIESITGILFIIFFIKFGLEKIYFFYIIIIGYLIVLTAVDIGKKIVPDEIIVFLLITGLLFNITEIKGFVTIFDGIVGAITAGLLSYFINFFSNENFGEGDVKLLMALGLCVGPKDSVAIIFYSCILAGFISLILRILK